MAAVFNAAALDATIAEINGKVEIRQGTDVWRPAEVGQIVPVGASISTSFNSTALLQVGASEVEVKPLTRVRIQELISEDGVDRSEVDMPVGRISANIRGGERRTEFTVRSPVATASVRGTSFDFDGVNLDVAEGIVVLANKFNEAVAVAQGEQSSASGNTPPQQPAQAAEESNSVTVSPGPTGARPRVRQSDTGGLTINWRIVN
jgi:hypothetical protein